MRRKKHPKREPMTQQHKPTVKQQKKKQQGNRKTLKLHNRMQRSLKTVPGGLRLKTVPGVVRQADSPKPEIVPEAGSEDSKERGTHPAEVITQAPGSGPEPVQRHYWQRS